MKNAFTLVELMIVVLIIVVLAAIAIPNIIRAKLDANEANAQITLRTLSTACEQYAAASKGKYPTSMDLLTNVTPPYIDTDFLGVHAGYNFSVRNLTEDTYFFIAIPDKSGNTGNNQYYSCKGARLGIYDPNNLPDCGD